MYIQIYIYIYVCIHVCECIFGGTKWGIYIYINLSFNTPLGEAPNKNNGYTGYLEGSTEQDLLVNMQTPRPPPPGYIVVYWVNIEIKF